MRRRLRLDVRFEPARLSADYLHHAYMIVVPIVQRTVRVATPGVERPVEPVERAHHQKKGKGA